MRTSLLIFVASVTLILSSALTRGEKRVPVSTPSETRAGGTEYRSRSGHFVLRYPSEWSSKRTQEHTLLLEREPTAGAERITVDVPQIPPHLPGMMTMKLVVKGYLDDLKERLDDFTVVERQDDRLASAAAQRLVATGRDRAGERRTIVALVAIRKEQVYILQADATPEGVRIARDAMTSIAESWDWTR
jgi:hypothetical protein